MMDVSNCMFLRVCLDIGTCLRFKLVLGELLLHVVMIFIYGSVCGEVKSCDYFGAFTFSSGLVHWGDRQFIIYFVLDSTLELAYFSYPVVFLVFKLP